MTKIRSILIGFVCIYTALLLFNLIATKTDYFKKPQIVTEKPAVVIEKPVPKFTDFHLLIPGLDISAPIIADVDGSDKTAYFAALQNGVAHFKGTSKPGENGNIFIFGHSSYLLTDPGKYKEIFVKLEDTKVGDEIDVWLQSKEYKYKVSETKVVKPSDVSVLEQTGTEQLTLMTCVPPGTTLKRLIVIAKPIK